MAVAVMDWASKQPALGPPHQDLPATEHPDEDENRQASTLSDIHSKALQNSDSPILQLPPELLHQILSYLSAPDLARISAVCRPFAEHAINDRLWAKLINSYLPHPISDPGIFDSFRSLYIAHHPCWFIPRNKIWFSDTEHTGNLILARYDHRRGVIEAYRVLAERRSHKFQVWEWNPDVIVQKFEPKVTLWLDDPVLLLKNTQGGRPRYLHREARMPMPVEVQDVFNALSLCSNDTPDDMDANTQWPPPTIPSDHRVYRDTDRHWSSWNQPPRKLSLLSEYAFRIRRWAHFRLGMPLFTTGRSETLSTYATLDPSLYTPTREKPYQGIWVGDYSTHGCEFLLVIQRDKEGEDQSNLEFQHEDIIQRGSLEAIKLTGDPNVPRGQISFLSDDIGPAGTVRIANEELFRGARIVRSRGHVAGLGFRDDTFITSQLILISPECVAHYWEAMGHISYYRRLDIDSLLQT